MPTEAKADLPLSVSRISMPDAANSDTTKKLDHSLVLPRCGCCHDAGAYFAPRATGAEPEGAGGEAARAAGGGGGGVSEVYASRVSGTR